ncbi:MAG: hypothetical protein ACO23G_11390 [Limnohabitans sp.]
MGYTARARRYSRRYAANEPEVRWWVWPLLAVIAAPPTLGISLLVLVAYPLIHAFTCAALAPSSTDALTSRRSMSAVAKLNADRMTSLRA